MKRIFKLIEKYYVVIILLTVIITLIYPNTFKWVMGKTFGANTMNILLGVILFGMGTTLKVENFVNVFKRPKDVLVGISIQYIVMPLLALSLAKIFSLNEALTIGLMLVGTVPGGTASDVITFLAKGDLALSVSLTTISTIISPILTPLITLYLIGNRIAFDPVSMFLSIVEIVLVPIGLGLLINYKLPKLAEKLKVYLPGISSIAICIIIGGVLGVNKEAILTTSGIILVVIILQYLLAMGIGLVVCHLCGMKYKQSTTIAIELAFQNSGLSTSLAQTHFPHLALATVPGALYSVWQNLAGAILAAIFKRYMKDDVEDVK